MNKLFYGDCLTVMQEMKSNSVDLIYLDPPFNSNRQYNSIYKDETGRPLPDQIDAFCDMWEIDAETERAYRTMPVLMREAGIDDATVEFWRLWMNALRQTQPRLLAYLVYMVQRLLQMRIILLSTGSIFLHCDQTASHYIKIMMDAIFGHQNFRNEIIWQRAAGRAKGSQHAPRSLGVDTDSILHYSKTDRYLWNAVYAALTEDEMRAKFPRSDDQGRYHTDVPIWSAPSMGARPNLCYTYQSPHGPVTNPHPSGWRVSRERLAEMDAAGEIIWRKDKTPLRKSYAHRYMGKPIGSLWLDIPNVGGSERMGYATQKPIALLERIILASTSENATVLDPFAGCATTLEAAHRLGRRWIGVDIAIHAVKRVARQRLVDRLGLVEGTDFQIDGVPRNVEGARDLWTRDPYHFQKWAVEQADGFVTARRTADGGIDGRIYFELSPAAKQLDSMVLEVKGGKNINIGIVRALRGVLEKESALLAGLIVLEDLSDRQRGSFERFMAEAGDLEVHGILYPRMQLLTARELLDGRRFKTPTVHGRREAKPVLPGINP
ncbi:MAG: DNA methyltransferase [bacterium]|nr:DNA methyltransferase [bacterium]